MLLAEVIRSGFAESRHRGAVVVLGPGGQPVLRAGEVTAPAFPRSANKPMQAAGMLRAGLDLDGKLLALAAASHSGEAFHVAGVREILAGAGLNEGALRCPPALPLDERALRRVLREGGDADRVHMNCSGKHAAMLATCAAAGWPTGGYLDPDHPLQRALRADKLTIAALEGTLTLYLDSPRDIPVLRMLHEDIATVRARAERLAKLVRGEVEETVARAGGGALPLAELPSYACAVEEELAAKLRGVNPPVIAVVRDGRTLLDCRTLTDAESTEVAAAISAARK